MNRWLLTAGPAAALALFAFLQASGWNHEAAVTASVTLLCAIWWVFEPVPIPFTSLLPIALFPLFGVLTPAQVGQAFGSPLILLLMGGFMLSTAMSDSGAHRRIALYMVNLFGGGNARGLVLGFMAAAALLSMWISNTATTLMLLPVALAVLSITLMTLLVVQPASGASARLSERHPTWSSCRCIWTSSARRPAFRSG